MKRPLHPILFWIYPVLYLYSENTDIISFLTALWPLLIALGLGIATWALATWRLHDLVAAGLIATVIATFFFAHGHAHSALHEALLGMEAKFSTSSQHGEILMKVYLHAGLLVLWSVAFILIFRLVKRAAAATLAKVSAALNVMALIMLLFPIISIVAGSERPTAHAREVERRAVTSAERGLVRSLGYKPDIYNIVLDGYGREDVLRDYFGFDNGSFLNGLKERGFRIVPGARANYDWTFLSMASWLNLRYVNELGEDPGPESTNRARAYVMVRDSEVTRFLRARHYRHLHLKSTWGATLMNMYADEEIPCGGGVFQNEFYRVLAESSLLKIWESPVGVQLAACHLNNLETLAGLGPTPGPKFVYAHFVPPHHPYVFDREGNVLRHATVSNQFEFQLDLWHDKAKFIDQTVFMNGRLLQVVDQILAGSAHPPIIVLQSDHGPQVLDDARQRHPDYYHGRLSVFLAVHLPGAENADILPDELTLVNLYASILNAYFGTDYARQPDRYWVSPFLLPYQFHEVVFTGKWPKGKVLSDNPPQG